MPACGRCVPHVDALLTHILDPTRRVAAAAVVLAMVAGASSAHAGSSGGIGGSTGGSGGSSVTAPGEDSPRREWMTQLATWYGPGFFGNQTACGKTLTRTTVGVAHRTLPCRTRIVLRYDGRTLRTRVIDRGPYANGAKWDLTQAAAQRLGFEYTDEIAVARLGA